MVPVQVEQAVEGFALMIWHVNSPSHCLALRAHSLILIELLKIFSIFDTLTHTQTMADTVMRLAKRIRARSISLPIAPASTATFSTQLDIEAARQRAVDWEPTLNFTDLRPRETNEDGEANNTELAHTCTYSCVLVRRVCCLVRA